ASRAKELIMLKNMAERYASLKEFLADVSVDPDKEDRSDAEYLTLSTVHSAKGLEWGRVFLIGLVEGVFPSSRSIVDSDPNDMEEEQRLLYVAVTRAKEELFLSLHRKGGSGEKSHGMCRFLEPKNVRTTFEERLLTTQRQTASRYPGFRRR
ncbi:MAG: 3'-5' exonuclease, partial [Syntrophorhabdales bacterium]